MVYKLKKPVINGNLSESFSLLFSSKKEQRDQIEDFIKRISEDEYLYWDKAKHKEPSPKNISKEKLWTIAKFLRQTKSSKTLIKNKDGSYFTWSKLKYFEELLHLIDLNTGGEIFIGSADAQKIEKQKLITRGIIEEAIASSQLEGAATSRKVAKEMIQEGRKPKNESEQMILNNYTSLKAIEEKYKDEKMSIDLLLELHSLTTKDTFDSSDEAPRLRKKGEPVVVSDKATGEVYHEGPPARFVAEELKRLVDFANNEIKDGDFVHPVIKAIMLHFWIGYLHPFTDGNGRLARLIFYWYLLKEGYWAFSYLPISKVIKKSPVQYIMSYVYSEQDDNDLTYFIDYNFRKIEMALKEFKSYLKEQSNNNFQMKKNSEIKFGLNVRQVQLLQHLYGDPDARTTIVAHMNVNQVSRMTAFKDLKDLTEKGFLLLSKQGKNIYYYSSPKVKGLF